MPVPVVVGRSIMTPPLLTGPAGPTRRTVDSATPSLPLRRRPR
jgi:hypothetical protein